MTIIFIYTCQIFFLEMLLRVLQFKAYLFSLFMAYTVSRDEASKMLGVSTRTIDRYIAAGKLRSKREGKSIMLHADDVKKYQAGGGEQKDYEVLPPKPVAMPAISYDPRESQNEILHAIETIIREKDAIIQELTFKIGKME